MGGCTSATATSSTVIATKNSLIAGSSSKNHAGSKKLISIDERDCLNFLDKLESEVNEALEDFYALEDQFKTKLENILEKSQIYSQTSHSKSQLLKQIQENKVPFQQERLVEIVHVLLRSLPNIVSNLQYLKQTLQTDPKLAFDQKSESENTFNDSRIQGDQKNLIINKKYSIIYKIDEARVEELMGDITEWNGLLQKETSITYQDFQERKRLSHQQTPFTRSLTQRRATHNPVGGTNKNLTTLIIPKRATFVLPSNHSQGAQPFTTNS